MTEELFISIPLAVSRMHVSRSFIYERMARGEIRSVKAGRRRLIEVASFNEWAASLPESQLKETTTSGTIREM
jgi:excisionase family DNA binding protein